MKSLRQYKLQIALLFLSAAVLRITLAFHPGLWADEIFSLAIATGHSLEHPAEEANPALGDYVESRDPQPASALRRYMEHDSPPAGPGRVIRAVQLSDTSPPLYYLALNVWTRVFGTDDAALRLFSAFWAIACFPLLWLLGSELGGKRAARVACVLFTLSPLALYYSAEGRMYSLVWLLALLLAWSSFGLYKQGPRPYLLSLWILSAAAGLMMHYYFVFVLAACLAWMFFHAGRTSRVYAAGLVTIAVLIVVPWYSQLPEILSRWHVTDGWLAHPLTWKEVITNPAELAWRYLSVSGIWGGSRRGDIAAYGLFAALGLLTLRIGARQFFTKECQLVWFWALASTCGLVVFDLLRGTNSSSVARYALPGLPAAILILAMAISRLSPKTQMAFLILLPLIWSPGIYRVFAEPARYFAPFPEVGSRLSAWSQPEDLIIIHSIPSGILGVARYLDDSTPIVSWVVQLKQRSGPNDMERLTSSHRRVALVKSHDMDEPSPAEVWLSQNLTLQGRDTLFVFKNSATEILYFQRKPEWHVSKSP